MLFASSKGSEYQSASQQHKAIKYHRDGTIQELADSDGDEN